MTTDYLGDPGASASRMFTVDAEGPVVVITNPDLGQLPGGGLVSDEDASFEYTTSPFELGATFECRLDTGALEACDGTRTFTGLVHGSQHTFSVRGIDRYGNAGSAATKNWVVDTIDPNTEITGPPAGKPFRGRIPIRFAVTDPDTDLDVTFTCQLDNRAPIEDCTSPHRLPRLSQRKHTFTVFATDSAGNADPTPAKRKVRPCGGGPDRPVLCTFPVVD